MPPKKDKNKEEPPPVVPLVEPVVELPEVLAEDFREPSFSLVLGHIFGHQFRVPRPEKEGEELSPENPPTAVDFDPRTRLLARAKEPEDAILKSFSVVEREDLQAIATAENSTLLAALRTRLQKERAARSVAKSNRARRRAIEAFEAAQARESEEGESPAESPLAASLATLAQEPQAKADFVLVLADYPADETELQELADQGFCAEGLVDLWTSVYLAGETLEGAAPDEADTQQMKWVPVEMPASVRFFFDSINAAPNTSELADCTVCTYRNSQRLVIAAEDKAQGEHIQAAVLGLLNPEVASKARFCEWTKQPERVSIPRIAEHKQYGELRLYERMMGSIDPVHHDVPLFLHCLTAQVDLTLTGDAHDQEFSAAFSSLQDYMGAAFDGVLTEGLGGLPRPPSRLGATASTEEQVTTQAVEESGPLAPTPNLMDCVHLLGASTRGDTRILGKEPVAEVVEKVLSEVRAPGVRRSGLPEDAVHTPAQLKALRSRLYPFAPVVAHIECEHMALLHAFEQLLERAQPDRHWCLTDRNFRELIPREFLAHSLAAALRTEPFMDTAYLPRQDCLLIALHHWSFSGRVMWHSWQGDLLSEPESAVWQQGYFPSPTFNDWSMTLGAKPMGVAPIPQPRYLLEGLDARAVGYSGMVEKLATPADGSIILITTTQIGLQHSFPEPCNALAAPAMPKWHAPPARKERLARVMKDGLAFGIVQDTTWKFWCQRVRAKHFREVAAAEAAAAEAVAAAAASEVEGADQTTGEIVDQPQAFEPPFQGAELGTFWVALPNGARCSTRMHHERVLVQNESELDGVSLAAQSLPSMGVVLSYTMTEGQVIQVFSDGSVQLLWPLALHDGVDASAAAAALSSKEPLSAASSTLSAAPRQPVGGDKHHFEPGCPEDVEMSRTITPFGSLIRRLLSGRVEVCHADGTIATRNPTREELRQHFERLQNDKRSTACASQLELLRRLTRVYEERHTAPAGPPSEKAKAAGLPGHWVVVRPDGRVFGRAPAPQTPPPTPPAADASAAESGAEAPLAEPATPPLYEILGGVLIQGGTAVQYDITPISKALQVDLQSQHRSFTNQFGLTSFEDPQGIQRVNVHTDGTQVVRTQGDNGYEVSVSRVPMAHVRCVINNSPSDQGMTVIVECSDGTRIEVVPQMNGAHHASFAPLIPGAEDLQGLSTNASVVLECRSGTKIVSSGSGQVDVFTGNGKGGYTALCHQGRLVLRDEEHLEYTLHTDQTLSIVDPSSGHEGPRQAETEQKETGSQSPRCLISSKAYRRPESEALSLPESPPAPRLFAVYGDGTAEELLEDAEARRLLEESAADPNSIVVGGQPLGPQMEMCHSHSIFQVHTADTAVVPPPPAIALPESCDGSPSLLSLKALPSLVALPVPGTAPPVTGYRQLVEYPTLTQEQRSMFRGTLLQYRQWEAETQANRRAFMVPEPKSKKDAKGKKDESKKEEKGKNRRSKKSEVVDVPPVEVEEVQPEPTFVPDLQLTPFDHLVQVLRARAKEDPVPEAVELLARAKASQEGEQTRIQAPAELVDEDVEITDIIPANTTGSIPPSPVWDAHSPKSMNISPLAGLDGSENELLRETEVFDTTSNTGDAILPSPAKEATKPKKRAGTSESEVSFSYFKSDVGIQFLMDTGVVAQDPNDPDSVIEVGNQAGGNGGASLKPKRSRQLGRSPWNPRLVGEPETAEDPEPHGSEETTNAMPAVDPDRGEFDGEELASESPAVGPGHAHFSEDAELDRPLSPEDAPPFAPEPRVPQSQNGAETAGASQTAKAASLDLWGKPRAQKPPVSQARVEINTNYMEVEGPTDRRVRTSSVSRKKNAGKAPSVSTVRKTGTHALQSVGLAPQVPRESGAARSQEENWKQSSTMQGLGDSNNLVEVMPGACRFGPLRRGAMYQMNIFVRNLDVDMARYSVTPSMSEFVHVKYIPGPVAPGMAAKILVEIAALSSEKIEEVVEIKSKAHVISVPVTARVFEADEYDRLDNESLAINGRRIGRHRESDDPNKPGPVRLILDESYCRKVMGEAYAKPPGDDLVEERRASMDEDQQ